MLLVAWGCCQGVVQSILRARPQTWSAATAVSRDRLRSPIIVAFAATVLARAALVASVMMHAKPLVCSQWCDGGAGHDCGGICGTCHSHSKSVCSVLCFQRAGSDLSGSEHARPLGSSPAANTGFPLTGQQGSRAKSACCASLGMLAVWMHVLDTIVVVIWQCSLLIVGSLGGSSACAVV